MASVPSNRNPTDRNAEATVHIAQLHDKVTDVILWELMLQAGPVRHVYIPRNRITGSHFGYGFCEFLTALDAYYATKVFNMVNVFNKPIRISQSTVDRVSQDVGANLFIGNLVDEVDEKLLHDAFSAFGPLIDAPYIMRDLPNSKARRYGFIKYSRFEHADAAIAAMNGQYICNHPISVQFAFKKDSDAKERHGSQAERILAARALQASQTNNVADRLRPNTMFSDCPAKRLRPGTQPAAPSGAHLPQPQAAQPRLQTQPQPHVHQPALLAPQQQPPHPLQPPQPQPQVPGVAFGYGAPHHPPVAYARPPFPPGAPGAALPSPHHLSTPAWQQGAGTAPNAAQTDQMAYMRVPVVQPAAYAPQYATQLHTMHQPSQGNQQQFAHLNVQLRQPPTQTLDIGWSAGRRFGTRPQHSQVDAQAGTTGSAYMQNAKPVADEQAPPPPASKS